MVKDFVIRTFIFVYFLEEIFQNSLWSVKVYHIAFPPTGNMHLYDFPRRSFQIEKFLSDLSNNKNMGKVIYTVYYRFKCKAGLKFLLIVLLMDFMNYIIIMITF